jgi:hypothetical protein
MSAAKGELVGALHSLGICRTSKTDILNSPLLNRRDYK